MDLQTAYTVFQGTTRIAFGSELEVTRAVKSSIESRPEIPVLVFEDRTGRQIDLDLRVDRSVVGPQAEQAGPEARGRGRPRLGVVSREVTLLPRHWEWLNGQSGGASVALRKLVEMASLADAAQSDARFARQAADRFMIAMAGDLPRYEEAARALYAGDGARFEIEIAAWPPDVRAHALKLATPGLEADR